MRRGGERGNSCDVMLVLMWCRSAFWTADWFKRYSFKWREQLDHRWILIKKKKDKGTQITPALLSGMFFCTTLIYRCRCATAAWRMQLKRATCQPGDSPWFLPRNPEKWLTEAQYPQLHGVWTRNLKTNKQKRVLKGEANVAFLNHVKKTWLTQRCNNYIHCVFLFLSLSALTKNVIEIAFAIKEDISLIMLTKLVTTAITSVFFLFSCLQSILNACKGQKHFVSRVKFSLHNQCNIDFAVRVLNKTEPHNLRFWCKKCLFLVNGNSCSWWDPTQTQREHANSRLWPQLATEHIDLLAVRRQGWKPHTSKCVDEKLSKLGSNLCFVHFLSMIYL